jgi:hypothetical protein
MTFRFEYVTRDGYHVCDTIESQDTHTAMEEISAIMRALNAECCDVYMHVGYISCQTHAYIIDGGTQKQGEHDGTFF